MTQLRCTGRWLMVLAVLLLPACEEQSAPPAPPAPPAPRPSAWAVPIDKPGLPNLHKINDNLYRGAQPEEEGFAQLKAMGIKTVVNLRTYHSDRDECEENGLGYVKITMQAHEAEDEEVVDFLKVVIDPDRWPVFFHCMHGADRTGTASAMYRIVVQGWSKQDAIEEMVDGEYNFHKIWKNLIKYVREADIDSLKEQAGIVVSKPLG